MSLSALFPAGTANTAIVLFAVQFLLAISWTVYVAFLPQLAAKAGIAASAVAAILMLDQLLFALGDFTAGVAADRTSRAIGKFGRRIVIVGLFSSAAFLLLPRTETPALFLGLIVVWTLCSSALRAPIMGLVGKHAPALAVPRLATMSLLGLGFAGAFAPYLTAQLRGVTPEIPFALASVALAAATLALLKADVLFSPPASAATPAADVARGNLAPARITLFLALTLAAAAFQIHFFVGSAPAYLRFAEKSALEQLMPVFWIGFNLGIVPVGLAFKHLGRLRVMTGGALLGAMAAFLAASVTSLEMLVVWQFLAGVGWACIMLAAITVAIELGHTGFEGRMVGLIFGLLAFATLARIAAVSAQLTKDPALAATFAQLPWLLWGGAAMLLLATGRLFRPAASQQGT